MNHSSSSLVDLVTTSYTSDCDECLINGELLIVPSAHMSRSSVYHIEVVDTSMPMRQILAIITSKLAHGKDVSKCLL